MGSNYIVQRQTPDWLTFDLEQSRPFLRGAGLNEDLVIDFARIWDKEFRVGYREWRDRVKQISLMNYRSVGSASLMSRAEFDRISISPDDLILFIDDDDWLHPQLYFELQRYVNGADGYVFGNILCASRVQLRRVEDGCYTNNYAVSAHYLRALDGRTERVAQHWDAHEAFHAPGFRLTHVPLYLSATNKHPASAMKLKDGLQQAELSAATLRRLVERYVDEAAQAEIPEPASWVATHRQRVRDVFARLL